MSEQHGTTPPPEWRRRLMANLGENHLAVPRGQFTVTLEPLEVLIGRRERPASLKHSACGQLGMTSGPTGRRPPPCALGSRRRASLPVDHGHMRS